MSEVSDLLPPLDEPGDAELISAVRGGDTHAYGLLFERHVESARRLSRQLVSAGDVDDLVSEAFAKVLGVLQRGGGPDLAFRAYLLTSIRRLHVDKLRAGARLTTTDDLTPYDPGVPFNDTAVAGFENATAAKAFASLPERWQQVLWHTEVEGQKPAEVAPLLGMSANSVSALAYRAREGLREAFISMHAQDTVEDACATTRANLGAYIRGGTSRRDAAKVEAHLQDCRACSAIYLELGEVNANLGAVLAPLLLGSAGAGYLAAAHAATLAAAKGGVVLFLDRAKDWVLHNPAGRAAGGTAAAAAVAVAVAAGIHATGGPDAKPIAAPSPAVTSAPPAPAPPASPTPPPPAAPTAPPVTPPPAIAAVAAVRAPAAPAPTTPVTTKPEPEPVKETAPVITTPLADVTVQVGSSSVSIDLTDGATDPNGDPLSIASVSIAGASPHGRVTLGADVRQRPHVGIDSAAVLAKKAVGPTTVTYTPDVDWRGTETITYTLTDGHGGTVRGTVNVTTPDKAPIPGGDHLELHAAYVTPAATVIAVLANDTDANHDLLTVISVSTVTGDAGGSVTLAGGIVTYTPGLWSHGDTADRTDTFTYLVSDGFGGTATGTVTLVVGLNPDLAPVPGSSSAATHWSSSAGLDLPATDADGDDLTFALATGAAHGSVALSPSGHATYTPSGTYVGTDSFTWTVTDGKESASGVTTIELTNAHPARADDDTRQIADGTTATVTIPATDADGDPITVSDVDGGTLTVPTTDGYTISWTSPYGEDSDHTISYTVDDGVSTASAAVQVQSLTPRATLSLSGDHGGPGNGDEVHHFTLNGLPAGRHAIVTLHLSGQTTKEQYAADNGADCDLPAWSTDPMTIVCRVDDDQRFLHLDFNHGAIWSLTATVQAVDFHADDVAWSAS